MFLQWVELWPLKRHVHVLIPVNVTLFGKKDLCRFMLRISRWRFYPRLSRWPLNAMVGILREEQIWRWSQRLNWPQAEKLLEPPKAVKIPLPSALRLGREHDPVDLLISGFKPPELWENTFLSFFFIATKFVLICCSKPRKLRMVVYTSASN